MFKKKNNNVINKIYHKVFKKIFSNLKNVFSFLFTKKQKKKIVESYINSEQFNKFKNQVSKELTKKLVNENKTKWKDYYNNAKKNHLLNLPPYMKFEEQIKNKMYKKALNSIKSIPNNILELNKLEYLQALEDQVIKGTATRGEFEAMLKEIGSKHAKVIARTETARMQTAVMQHRSEELGIKCYKWSSSADQRTRPSHREMNNVLVLWSDKEDEKPYLDGMYGNAGEFPNCRCNTLPIGIMQDLPSGNVLKVWDYKTKKIIKITRKQVIKKLFNKDNA